MGVVERVDQSGEIRAYLGRVGHWRPEFEPKVQELVQFRQARLDALARAQESPVVVGSTGQPKENPAWEVALKFQTAIDRLTDQLLLSPKAAAAAGIRQGDDDLSDILGD